MKVPKRLFLLYEIRVKWLFWAPWSSQLPDMANFETVWKNTQIYRNSFEYFKTVLALTTSQKGYKVSDNPLKFLAMLRRGHSLFQEQGILVKMWANTMLTESTPELSHGGLIWGHSVTSWLTHQMTHTVRLLWAFC